MTRWTAGLLAAGCAVLMAGSCSKKTVGVDPAFTVPEGKQSNAARLVLWPERPNILALFKDIAPPGEGEEDEFLGFLRSDVGGIGGNPLGTVNGMILDNTVARGYQLFRRESNGGLRPLTDFTIQPAARWPDGKWELYRFFDSSPTASPSYVGRGLIAGEVTAASPLTNTATLPSDTLYNIDITFVNDTQDLQSPVNCPDPRNRPCRGDDSTVTWRPVPGAVGYLVQIYRQGEGSGREVILSGRPALLADDEIHHFVVGDASQPIRFGINQAFLGTPLTAQRTPHVGEYLVRVSAIGSRGQLLGMSFVQCESFASALNADDPTVYARFPLGAVRLPHVSLNEPEKKSCSNRNLALANAYRALLSGSTGSAVFTTERFLLDSSTRFAGNRWVLRD